MAATGPVTTIAGAGAVSWNTVNLDIQSYSNKSVIETTDSSGKVTIGTTSGTKYTQFRQTFLSQSYVLGLSLQYPPGTTNQSTSVAAGVGIAFNTLYSNNKVYIKESKIDSGGSVELSSNSSPIIKSTGIGVAVSGASGTGSVLGFAGVGSAAKNVFNNKVEVALDGKKSANEPSIKAAGSIQVEAKDDSDINATAGGLALSVQGGTVGGATAGAVGVAIAINKIGTEDIICLLYTSPSPRDATLSRMPSSA